ncbi:MAG TPA: hypothetical protein VM118_07380 [Acidobacteriota bacterium]|nr:hypothetical protein [Acidobacteriota bacterium]
MKTGVLQAVTLALTVFLTGAPSMAEDYYYSLDTSWAVSPSDQRIAVQFDTTGPPPAESTFYANHPILDDTIPVEPGAPSACGGVGFASAA